MGLAGFLQRGVLPKEHNFQAQLFGWIFGGSLLSTRQLCRDFGGRRVLRTGQTILQQSRARAKLELLRNYCPSFRTMKTEERH